jgi:hypothetical protein
MIWLVEFALLPEGRLRRHQCQAYIALLDTAMCTVVHNMSSPAVQPYGMRAAAQSLSLPRMAGLVTVYLVPWELNAGTTSAADLQQVVA